MTGAEQSDKFAYSSIVRNFALLGAGDLVSKACLFVATILLARALGVEGFGIFGFVQSYVLVLMFLTDLGTEWKAVDYVAKTRIKNGFVEAIQNHINEIISLRLILAVAAFALLLASCIAIDILRANLTLVVVLGLSVFVSAVLMDWIFTGLGKSAPLVTSRVLRALVYLILTIILVQDVSDLWIAGLTYTTAFFLGSIFLLYVVGRDYGWRYQFRLTVNQIIPLLGQAIPFFMYALLAQLFYLIAILLIQGFEDERTTGLYSAAYRVIALIIPIGSYFISAMYPHITHSRVLEDIHQILPMLILKISFVAFITSATVAILADFLITAFYGTQFESAGAVLQVLSFSIPFVLISLLLGAFLNALGKEYESMKAIMYALLIMFPSALLFDHYFETLGVAIAVILSSIMCTLYMVRSISEVVEGGLWTLLSLRRKKG